MEFTKDQLYAAFLAWERDCRIGPSMSREDVEALPLEEVATRATDTLIIYLDQVKTAGE